MKSRYLILSLAMALAASVPQSKAALILGSAGSFAVLGGSTVASSGNTVVNGDLGVAPGTAITGLPPGVVNGVIHSADTAADQAQTAALAAYHLLAGEAVTQDLSSQDLGSLTLTPGVYKFDSSAQLTGTLTLSGNGRFDFLIGSTLTTAGSSLVLLVNGAQVDNVFWQVGSSATLGTATQFSGSILADQSITLTTGADLIGRALALNGAVTLDSNVITVPVPEPGTALAGAGAALLGAWQLLVVWRRKPARS